MTICPLGDFEKEMKYLVVSAYYCFYSEETKISFVSPLLVCKKLRPSVFLLKVKRKFLGGNGEGNVPVCPACCSHAVVLLLES